MRISLVASIFFAGALGLCLGCGDDDEEGGVAGAGATGGGGSGGTSATGGTGGTSATGGTAGTSAGGTGGGQGGQAGEGGTAMAPITVTAPNGGETLTVGQPYAITWTTDGISDVEIILSTDNGATFVTPKLSDTTDTTSPDWQNFEWTPTADHTCDQCIIRIAEYNNTSTFDDSDATFTVSQ